MVSSRVGPCAEGGQGVVEVVGWHESCPVPGRVVWWFDVGLVQDDVVRVVRGRTEDGGVVEGTVKAEGANSSDEEVRPLFKTEKKSTDKM